MPSCLIVENDGPTIDQIRNALASEGWPVHVAEDAQTALNQVYDPVPDLVLVNSTLDDAETVLSRFSRKNSSSCSISLQIERSEESTSPQELEADEQLPLPFEEAQFWAVVRALLSARFDDQQPAPEVPAPKLTSEEIFGDVLAELDFEPEDPEPDLDSVSPLSPEQPVESTAAATPPSTPQPLDQKKVASKKPRNEVERKLEETLSGVLEPSFLSPKTQPPPTKTPLKRDLSNIDKLLSDSLSGLDLGKKLKTDKAQTGDARAAEAPREPPPHRLEDSADRDALLADLDLSFLDKTPTSQVIPPGEDTPSKGEPAPARAIANSAEEPTPTSEPVDLPVGPSESTGSRQERAGGPRFGHYTLLEKIAVGGMAEVWKARMDGVAGFQKTVAIKKILSHLTENKEFERMFVDEAKLAAELNHPNITHIYDLGVIQSEFYIAMEYVEGGNLRSILDTASRKGMPIPQDLSLLITSRMASALDYAHRKRDGDDKELGLVHRDVSPQNVLISYEGDIKLCDFGIVKAVSKTSQTKAGALKGKLQYMAPEQAWGREVDGRSDIFSLGTLLFEMLTGSRLFPGDDELAILETVRECKIQEPKELDPTIPDSINALVTKSLARDPKDRFQSADRLRDEIESCLENLTLRPSNADLAAYLRRLMSAAEPDDDFPDEPTDLADRVARFPLPSAEPPQDNIAEEQAEPSTEEASAPLDTSQEPTPESELGTLVEAIAPVEDVSTSPPAGTKRWLWVAVAIALLAAALFLLWWRTQPSAAPPTPSPAATQSQPSSEERPANREETTPAGEPDQEVASPAAQEPAPDSEDTASTPLNPDQEREKAQHRVVDRLAAQASEPPGSHEAQAQAAADPSQIEPGSPSNKPVSQGTVKATSADISEPPVAKPAQAGPGIKPPVLVSMKKPQYPAEARKENVKGEIVLSLLVNESGNVDEVRQVAGVDPSLGLNEAAIRAARAATFKPATQEGTRVKMWTTLKIPYPM
ncbi:MAG: TonB family protein [Deltaproteobacteria bacterium]|nr:TonB family protein [Deltaproteobacteria bacterium]